MAFLWHAHSHVIDAVLLEINYLVKTKAVSLTTWHTNLKEYILKIYKCTNINYFIYYKRQKNRTAAMISALNNNVKNMRLNAKGGDGLCAMNDSSWTFKVSMPQGGRTMEDEVLNKTEVWQPKTPSFSAILAAHGKAKRISENFKRFLFGLLEKRAFQTWRKIWGQPLTRRQLTRTTPGLMSQFVNAYSAA